MTTRIGINGFGRIGRQVLRAIIQRQPDKLSVGEELAVGCSMRANSLCTGMEARA